jgi:uncharacterized protein (DUF169 family)
MTNYKELAASIEKGLQLETSPIGVAFLDAPPAGVAVLDAKLPSACSLWRKAEKSLFYAPAELHFNCAVGAMVMGFPLPNELMSDLNGLVTTMCNCNYIEAAEAASIPVMKGKNAGAMYGPVALFPTEPDLMLLWLSPKQAMLYSEATGSARWMEHKDRTVALGRPACAALPAAINEKRATLSLGCMGMRTFTEIADNRLLAVLPLTIAEEFQSRFRTCIDANGEMRKFYEERKRQISAQA